MSEKIEYAVLYLCVLAKSSGTKTERESAGVKRTPSTSNSTSSTTTTSKGEITLKVLSYFSSVHVMEFRISDIACF